MSGATDERQDALNEAWEWFNKFNEKAPTNSGLRYAGDTLGTKVTAPTEVWAIVKDIARWMLNTDALVRRVMEGHDD